MKDMKLTTWKFTFQPMFRAKIAQLGDRYGPTITHQWSKDENLLPHGVVKEHITRTKDRVTEY